MIVATCLDGKGRVRLPALGRKALKSLTPTPKRGRVSNITLLPIGKSRSGKSFSLAALCCGLQAKTSDTFMNKHFCHAIFLALFSKEPNSVRFVTKDNLNKAQASMTSIHVKTAVNLATLKCCPQAIKAAVCSKKEESFLGTHVITRKTEKKQLRPINRILKLLRHSEALTIKELSDLIPVSANYISEIESDKKSPSLKVIRHYAEYFDVRASGLIFLAEEKLSESNADLLLQILEMRKDDGNE